MVGVLFGSSMVFLVFVGLSLRSVGCVADFVNNI